MLSYRACGALLVGAAACGVPAAGKEPAPDGGADATTDAGADAMTDGAPMADGPWQCPAPARWVKRWGDHLEQTGLHVAAAPGGDIVIVGSFRGTLAFGGGATLTRPSTEESLFVARLSPDGQHRWSHAYRAGIDVVSANGGPFATVAVDPSGGVVMGGVFSGTVDFGGGPITAASPDGDGFVVALDEDGHHRWTAHYGDAPGQGLVRPQAIESLAVDRSGNVLALGYRETGAFGAMFLVKLDPAGNVLWQKQLSTDGTLQGTVRADEDGSVLLTGISYGMIDLGGGPLPGSPVLRTFFRAKLDATGEHLWSAGVMSLGFKLRAGNGLEVDPMGNVFIAGGGGDLAFDVGCGLADQSWGTKVMLFDGASGDCLWMSGTIEMSSLLALDPQGRPVVASDTLNRLDLYPGSGPADSPCEESPPAGDATRALNGLAADAEGRLLMTGGFTGELGFGEAKSAGAGDVFLARF